MTLAKEQRIGIIGAGPSGLAAAEALKELGYKNIMLLEKRQRVGGQSLSKKFRTPDGKEIIYELGSLQPFGTGKGILHQLIKKYQLNFGRTITLKKPIHFRFYSVLEHKIQKDFSRYLFGQPLSFYMKMELIHDLFVLISNIFRYRTLKQPGYSGLSLNQFQELSEPMEDWVDKLKLKLVGEDLKFLLGSILTFSNRANKDDVSAFRILKLMIQCFKAPIRYLNGSYLPIKEGYQELWNRISLNHQIKLNTKIKKITRSGTIKIETDQGDFEFDQLIISCSPKELFGILDESSEEKSIFNKVIYCPGWRAAFTAKHLPHDAGYALAESYFGNQNIGLGGFVPDGQIDQETWLYSSVLAGTGISDIRNVKALIANAEKTLIDEFGAKDIHWVDTAFWQEYSPHFKPEDIKQGIHLRIEELQGKNNTFYVGEVISGSSHAVVTEYSYFLIHHYF